MTLTDRRISVIIAAYNAETMLGTALAGVAGQTLAAHEVIVSDDASTDDTVGVAKRWQDALPLRILTTPTNGGVGTSRRRAIETATGDWIAILDADDCFLPDHLRLLAVCADRPHILACAQVVSWYPGSRVLADPYPRSIPEAPEQLGRILHRNFVSIGTLFPRELYDRAGGFSSQRVAEDWDLWIRMLLNGGEVRLSATPSLLYRKRADSLSADPAIYPESETMLAAYVGRVPGHEADLDRGLRRLRAERHMIEASTAAAAGDEREARRLFLAAARDSRRFVRRYYTEKVPLGLRALAYAAAPQMAAHRREQFEAARDHQAG